MSNNTQANISTYSDLHKDLYGFRPRGMSAFYGFSEAQQRNAIEELSFLLADNLREEQEERVIQSQREFGPAPASPFAAWLADLEVRAIAILEARGGA